MPGNLSILGSARKQNRLMAHEGAQELLRLKLKMISQGFWELGWEGPYPSRPSWKGRVLH